MNIVTAAAVGGGFGGVVVAALAVGGAVAAPLRRIARQNDKLARQNEEFREDWYGQPARPGRDAEPGVMERLRKIEKELHPNGGSTMRDAINRLEQRFEDHLKSHGGQSSNGG